MNSKQSLPSRQYLPPKFEYNHKCDNCQSTFKNGILLQKHKCVKSQTSLNCPVCLKQFNDIALLNIHKKGHVKSNLLKNTSLINISPKKIVQKIFTPVKQTPTNLLPKTFKCRECPKVCESEEKASNHAKTHKTFICSSCFTPFSSKLTLENHRIANCVKAKPNNTRLTLSVGKSFLHTPARRLSIGRPSNKSENSSSVDRAVSEVILNCDKCHKMFPTFRKLYTHKVQVHGMDTPDKNLLTKPKKVIFKAKAAHGGIPPNDRLKKAYANLRKKLVEAGEIVVE